MKKTNAATCTSGIFAAGLVLFLLVASAKTRAQNTSATQAVMLAQLSGNDVTVTGPSGAAAKTAESGVPDLYSIVDGSTIVVHSGKARMDFTGGGEADICGPAKLTVLDSGEALTLALSFGRVHVKIDALRPITIYTPTILATPISIQEQPREMALGIANSGAMCVAATHGAVQVQQQLSGETLMIPEPSAVEVRDIPFGASPLAAGSCTCDFDEAVAQQEGPAAGTAAQNQPTASAPRASAMSTLLKPATPAAARMPAAAAGEAATQPSSGRREVATYTAANPTLKASYMGIGNDMEGATVSAVPLSVATVMLAKEADVQAGWTFQGTVIGSVANANQTQRGSRQRNKRGFWSRLRSFLFGSKS